MTKTVKILLTWLLSLSVCAAAEIASTTTTPNDADVVKQVITKFMQDNQIQGVAVELYVDGQPQHYYFGYAKADKKIPVTKNTIFELGSISKVMTSILLAQEIDAAKVQIDASVHDYLPNLSDEFDDVTLKNLATHTGGLELVLPETIKTPQELNNFLAQYKFEHLPNEKWIYSNISMGLLGMAVESATHQPLNTLYKQRILLPLHMQPIGISVPKTLQANLAQGYDSDGKAVAPMAMSLLPAGGQVKASASDMQHFLSAAIGLPGTPERILYPMRLTQSVYVELPNTLMQGLGWVIHPLEKNYINSLLTATNAMDLGPIDVVDMYKKPIYSGNMLIDKTGMTDGFRSYIAVIPNKKTGIVILANKRVYSPAIVQAARQILFTLNHISAETPQVAPVG